MAGTLLRVAMEFLREVRRHGEGPSGAGGSGSLTPVLSADQRRRTLQAYARFELAKPNKAQAFLNILARAIELCGGAPNRAEAVVSDIKAVIIGEDYTEGRGKGPYFVGNPGGIHQFLGATGFKPHLRDDYFQVQHAAAGLVIGYEHSHTRYGPVLEQFLYERELQSLPDEKEPQDAALYRATLPLGAWLRNLDDPIFLRPDAMVFAPGGNANERLAELPHLMMLAIGDHTCAVPPRDLAEPFDMVADARAREFDTATAAAQDSGQFDMVADSQRRPLEAAIAVGADAVSQTIESVRPMLDILGIDTSAKTPL